MTAPDVSRLSPSDVVAALRSYVRRYPAAALPLPDDPSAEEWATRIGPEGESVLDVVLHATSTLVLLERALHEVLTRDDPVLHGAVADGSLRAWDTPPDTSVQEALGRFTHVATSLADEVGRVPSNDWMRTGKVAGGGEVTAIDLAREAVKVGAEDLQAIDRTLHAVR